MNTNACSLAQNRSVHALHCCLRPLSKFLVFAVLTLIFFGALVTSNNAGLSVPDWPTSYGENMFLFPPSKWVGGIFYEHVHRLIASGIGFLTLLLTAAILIAEPRRWVKLLAVIALLAVIVQGILGGLTVIYKLPDPISVLHGMLAQTFFCLTIVIAYSQSKELDSLSDADAAIRSPHAFKLACMVWGLIFIQLFIGAVMRHAEAGLAVVDFPTMIGSWLPSLASEAIEQTNQVRRVYSLSAVSVFQVAIHLAHRMWGLVVIMASSFLLFRITKTQKTILVRNCTVCLGIGLFMQFGLGALAVLSLRQPYLTSLHVMVGALMLGLACFLVLRTYPIKG